jgi:hypothetical protein
MNWTFLETYYLVASDKNIGSANCWRIDIYYKYNK